jgi:hypothetical protein
MTSGDDQFGELDARGRRAADAVHQVVAAAADRPLRRPWPPRWSTTVRRRGVLAVAAAAVLVALVSVAVVVGNGVSHNHATDRVSTTSVWAPTVLPSGFEVQAAVRSNGPATPPDAVLFAATDPAQVQGAPAFVVRDARQRRGASAGVCEGSVTVAGRHITYRPCGAPEQADVTIAGTAATIQSYNATPLQLLAAAGGLQRTAAGYGIAAGGLPAGVSRLGGVDSALQIPVVYPAQAPTGGYSEVFTPGGSSDTSHLLAVTVAPDGVADVALLRLLSSNTACATSSASCGGGRPEQTVRIGDHDGWIVNSNVLLQSVTVAPGGLTTVVWAQDNDFIRVDAIGVTQADAIAAARSLGPVTSTSPARLRALIARDTNVPLPSTDELLGPLPNGQVRIAQGNDYGGPWRVTVQPETTDRPNAGLCVRTITTAACTEGNQDLLPDADHVSALFLLTGDANSPPALFVGVVGPDITGVQLRLRNNRTVTIKGRLLDVGHGLHRRVFVVPAPAGTTPDQIELVRKDGATVPLR